MTSRTEVSAARAGWILAMVALTLPAGAARAGERPTDLTQKKQREQTVRQDTDHLVRRVSTMLRVLDYYGADRHAERQVLNEVATVLSGLSKEQMADVIARLDAAAHTPDEQKVTKAVAEAYQQHRLILTRLRALLARYEAIQSLDRAAAKLDEASQAQLKSRLRTNQLIRDWLTAPPYSPRPNERTQPGVLQEIRQQADEQADLGQQVEQVLGELKRLQKHLPAGEQARLTKAEEHARSQQVLEHMREAARALRTQRGVAIPRWREAETLQRLTATDLQDLAQMLRTPADRLSALREARERLEQIVGKQEDLIGDATLQRDPRVQDRERQRREQGQATHSQEQGDAQGRLEHEAHGVRGVLKPHAAALADRLASVEPEMQQAEKALRTRAPDLARPRQENAASTLRAVQQQLDRAVAAAEKEHDNPLAALQKKAESVEQLLQAQKDLRQKTAEASQTGHPQRLPHLTDKQRALAQQTADIRQQASPARASAQQALDHAMEAMQAAAHALATEKGKQATTRQDRAIDSLAAAKKHLDEQVAAMQKRRDDSAALEDARARLEQLAREENQVADQAKRLSRQGDPGKKDAGAGRLGSHQEGLTAQAQAVHQEIANAAADAARHVGEATQDMQAAGQTLKRHQPAPAAEQAQQAAQKLQKAAEAVARALDQHRAEDLADQAAMHPDQLDPVNAADQLAKAVEQAKQAAELSKQAAGHAGESSIQKPKNLARLQKHVAERAAALKLDRARKPADAAAEALARGNLDAAVEQQKKALRQLQQAAGKEPAGHSALADPADAQNAPDLAHAQKELLDATRALARSNEATQAAEAALQQAQAQSPEAVQPQLNEAGKNLANAGQQLHQGQPQPAHHAQQQAIAQMTRALGMLQAAAAAMPRPSPQPPQPSPGQANGPGRLVQARQPASGKGSQRALSVQPRGRSNGNRVTRALPPQDEPARIGDVMGDGSFLHLPPRQRELIKQALNAALPPEYAALIQQYYVNVARGKPAARPRAPEKR